MCGRFTLTVHHIGEAAEQIEAWLDPIAAASYRPRYNIAPTDAHWIAREKGGRRELIPADWGLVNHWAKSSAIAAKQINFRAESIADKPAFRDAYRARRCLVPADGFYEWRGAKKAREPIWFHVADRSLLWLAGVYETWTDPTTGEVKKTFAIGTTAANEVVAPVHDRMPAIIRPSDAAVWLTADDPGHLLVPIVAPALIGTPASRRVNTTDHDDPDLLDADDPRVARQLDLFAR
jgi:putative SOS response-associated peptidase YedK